MKAILHGENNLEFRDFEEPDLQVDARDPEAHFSALQMFATSLAVCTYSVLAAYAEQIEASTEDLAIRLGWDYAEGPFRIGAIDMNINWPQLPENRLKAAQRAAAQCTLHNTLEHPPPVNTEVSR